MDLFQPTFILTLILMLISFGMHYGMYQSFKKNTEVKLQEYAGEIAALKTGLGNIQGDIKVLQTSLAHNKDENHKDLVRIEESINRVNDSFMKYLFNKSA